MVDLEEAYQVSRQAAEIAARAGNGWMATILRQPGSDYSVRYDKAPLELAANSERRLPAAWIAPNRLDVTDEFVQYARPLIGDAWNPVPLENGLQRFAGCVNFAPQKCPAYIPEAWRAPKTPG